MRKVENADKKQFNFAVTYRGMDVIHKGQKRPTWRMELLDEKGNPTDIWSECWFTGRSWQSSYLEIVSVNLSDALTVGLRSLLEYLDVDETGPTMEVSM